jgi:nucleotide-binding universal stress UspA family protein
MHQGLSAVGRTDWDAQFEESRMYKKILVPTDGSELSEQAVSAAIDFARLCGSEIVALSVAEPYPLIPAAEGAMVIDPGFETRTLQEMATATVDKVAQAARAAGIKCTTVSAVSMVPHEEIIRAAVQNHCDLIFMASHGRRGLSRLLAGSVTQNVLAYSSIPVMVLRPDATGGKLHLPGTGAAATP